MSGLELFVEAGPDAGRTVVLPVGRHRLGRSPACSVVVADPAIEPNHVLFDVGCDGIRMRQLTGRVPVVVAGRSSTDSTVLPGAAIEIGDSRFVVRPPAASCGPHRAPPFEVVLGVADEPSIPDVELDQADRGDGPFGQRHGLVSVDLGGADPTVVVVRGDHAMAAVRSIVVQLARHAAPAECRLIPRLADPRETAWIARLPHAGAPAGAGRIVVVADRVAALRSQPVEETIRDGGPLTAIVAMRADRSVPPECTSLLQLGPRWRGCWIPDVEATGAGGTVRLHVAGCSLAAAAAGAVGVSRDW